VAAFDSQTYVILPGTTSATTRSSLAPCGRCGETVFEVVEFEGGRIECQCPKCCKRGKGRVVGALSMTTGKGRVVNGGPS
jgi:hypothetical protein